MGDAGDGTVCMGSALRWSRDAFLDSVGVDVALLFCWLVFLLFFFYEWSRDGWMQHTLLVIGAAIDRAAKATAVKNVDFMLMDLGDEAARLLVFYMFSMSSPQVLMDREESKKKLSSVLEMLFHKRKKKPAPSPFLLCKNHLLLATRSRTQISCLFPVARSCLTAL